MASGVKQVGKAWHRVVLSEFELFGEQSCTSNTCFNSSVFSLLLPSHLLLFQWTEKWLNHHPAFVAKAGAGVGLPGTWLCLEAYGGSLPTEALWPTAPTIILLCSCWLSSGSLSAPLLRDLYFHPFPLDLQRRLSQPMSVCFLAVIPCSMPPERHSVMSKSAFPANGLLPAKTALPPSSGHTRWGHKGEGSAGKGGQLPVGWACGAEEAPLGVPFFSECEWKL